MATESQSQRNIRVDLENTIRDRDMQDMKNMVKQVSDQLNEINKRLSSIEQSMISFNQVKPKLDALIEADIERGGMAKIIKWVSVGTLFAAIGAVISGVVKWVLGHP